MQNKRHNGFTLIELLVVVAIIITLVAMLMPALAKARAQSLQVKCMAVHKQIVASCILYAQDWNVFFPFANWRENTTGPTAGDPPYPWYANCYIGGFMGNFNTDAYPTAASTRSFYCPAMPQVRASSTPKYWNGNLGIGANAVDPYTDGNNVFFFRTGTTTIRPVHYSQVLAPTKMIVFTDVMGVNSTTKLIDDTLSQTSWSFYYVGTTADRCVSYRHAQKTNATFADGHVESFSSADADTTAANTHIHKGLHKAYENKQVTHHANK